MKGKPMKDTLTNIWLWFVAGVMSLIIVAAIMAWAGGLALLIARFIHG